MKRKKGGKRLKDFLFWSVNQKVTDIYDRAFEKAANLAIKQREKMCSYVTVKIIVFVFGYLITFLLKIALHLIKQGIMNIVKSTIIQSHPAVPSRCISPV